MRAEMGAKKATEDRAAGSRQAPHPQGPARFGFTVTKKLGNAVTRNHIRRRLKEAVRHVAPDAARPDCDYVLIARGPAATLPFAALERDLVAAFAALNAPATTTARRRSGSPRNNPTHGRAGRPDPASEG